MTANQEIGWHTDVKIKEFIGVFMRRGGLDVTDTEKEQVYFHEKIV